MDGRILRFNPAGKSQRTATIHQCIRQKRKPLSNSALRLIAAGPLQCTISINLPGLQCPSKIYNQTMWIM